MEIRLMNLFLHFLANPQGSNLRRISKEVEPYRRTQNYNTFRRRVMRDFWALRNSGINVQHIFNEETEGHMHVYSIY